MAFDIDATAGRVYGIVGTGISLGVLAGTTGMVMRSMERNLYGRKDSSQRGWNQGGYGRNRTDICRHSSTRRTTRKKTTTKRKKTTKKRTRYTPRYTTQRSDLYNYNPYRDVPKFDITRY